MCFHNGLRSFVYALRAFLPASSPFLKQVEISYFSGYLSDILPLMRSMLYCMTRRKVDRLSKSTLQSTCLSVRGQFINRLWAVSELVCGQLAKMVITGKMLAGYNNALLESMEGGEWPSILFHDRSPWKLWL